jgi:hypothetical protein
VVFTSFEIGSESHDSLRYAYELLDWQTQYAFHCFTLHTTAPRSARGLTSSCDNLSSGLTARPPTTTTETKQHLDGKAGVQIYGLLGSEDAVT